MRSFLVAFVSSLLVACLAVPAAADCVFVNRGSSPNTVEALDVGSGGALTVVSGSPFPTNGGNQGQGLTLVGSRLYAVNTFPPGSGLGAEGKALAAGTVSGFTIGAGCSLALLPGSLPGRRAVPCRPGWSPIRPGRGFSSAIPTTGRSWCSTSPAMAA